MGKAGVEGEWRPAPGERPNGGRRGRGWGSDGRPGSGSGSGWGSGPGVRVRAGSQWPGFAQ